MITSSVKELEEAKAKIVRLEKALVKELASLPAVYGFNSLGAFVAALKAAGGRDRGRIGKSAAPKSRKRAKITDAIRTKVKALVKAGKTGSRIAKILGISQPSVQNIKKALGLVKTSRSSAKKTKIRRTAAKVVPKAKKRQAARTKAASASKPGPLALEPAPSNPA